jgi:hypothetical protein
MYIHNLTASCSLKVWNFKGLGSNVDGSECKHVQRKCAEREQEDKL